MKDRANLRAIKKLEKIAKLVEAKELLYTPMSDAELASQTAILRERYNAGESLDDLLPDAYAVCREASKRVLKQRHFHVQILGGIALHQGRICQMSTGEGKTLTETLPAYLNALTGKGVHIVTVNEYLATRDMEWMGKVFRFLGLTVGVTLNAQNGAEKKKAYACDITYGTNSEFGFDYLRDNMATSRENCVQRGLNFVIIDEVDSILIDEARTPLIISGPSGKSSDEYVRANRFVYTSLKPSTNVDVEGNTTGDEEPNGDYVVDMKKKTVRLTERGITKAEKYYELDNLSSPDNSEINHYINNALRAHTIMHRNEDYIVERGAVIIVDSFTGRKMEGRRYSQGLHQAIEAKERVPIKEENKTNATITLQNYFRMYRKLSGMTGTAKTEEQEFNTIYNIDVVVIPTNMPMIREDRPDRVYSTRQAKLRAIVEEIKKRNAIGQPILVGTVSVEKSTELSKLLQAEKITHMVLSAKEKDRKAYGDEAVIISQAGRPGKVTIATNMAGRGTDILLGGNPEVRAQLDMRSNGYHEKNGYTAEELADMTSFIDSQNPKVYEMQKVYRETLAKQEQRTAEERKQVLAAGGLCVIGTERHDSRRIDDQLRGRAGRQGDPGTSVFFISAEDDMIRIFGGDMMQRILAFMRVDEDTLLESKILTKGIESAQKRVEGMHFSSRKHVLQYDDVNNQQRKVIYKERDRILDNEDVHAEILDMVGEYARYALAEACDSDEDVDHWDLDKVNHVLGTYFRFEQPILTADDVISARQVCDDLTRRCKDYLDERFNETVDGNPIPFGRFERVVLLRTIDELWMDHLDALDDLRQGVSLQSLGQHDPLLVYKKEAYDMFEKLNEQIKVKTIRRLIFARLVPVSPEASKKPLKITVKNNYGEEPEQQVDPNRPLTKQEEYALKRQQRKANKIKK